MMSKRKPKGLLSFIRNTTSVAAYRDEMHVDMRTGFERFEIRNGAVQRTCFDVEEAAYSIRRASVDRFGRQAMILRQDDLAAARTRMAQSSQALFAELATDLAPRVQAREDFNQGLKLEREIRKEAPEAGPRVEGLGPVVVLDGPPRVEIKAHDELGEDPLLLDLLYYFFHFPSTRDALLKSAALSNALRAIDLAKHGQGSMQPALDALAGIKQHLDGTSVQSAEVISGWVNGLCALLAFEYQDRAYPICW